MLEVQRISKHYTGTDILHRISFKLNKGDRKALIGPNGAGKTTLLNILSGKDAPSEGEVLRSAGVQIGYLEQEMKPARTETVKVATLSIKADYIEINKRIQELNEILAKKEFTGPKEIGLYANELADLNQHFQLHSFGKLEGKAEQLLKGLGFTNEKLNMPLSQFSYGWQMRVELAKLLLLEPEILLLDEPTNHLDIESIQWLELYLKQYPGAILLVSHDRNFLDAIANHTFELTSGRLVEYPGNYSTYVQKREEQMQTEEAAIHQQQKQIREIERFIERFRYKATKAKQVQSRIKLLDKMEWLKADERDAPGIHFGFPPAPHSGKISLQLEGLKKAYGDHIVLRNINLLLGRGERIAFVGKNGEGKTTLSKIIAGKLAYEGKLKLGHLVQIGYYAQNQHETLDMDLSVFETLERIAVGEVRKRIRSILGSFMFSGPDIDKKVSVLSGGEKSRLSLAKLLIQPSNFLILDEPTNHLDMRSKDILKHSLLQFEGTLIVVSHDRDFLQGLTDKVYEFKNQGIKEFIGDIDSFIEQKNLSNLTEIEKTQTSPSVKQTKDDQIKSSKKQAYLQRKEAEKKHRSMLKQISQVESSLEETDRELHEINRLLADPASHADIIEERKLYNKFDELTRLQNELLERWETLLSESTIENGRN